MWREIYQVIEPGEWRIDYPLEHWDSSDYGAAKDAAYELDPGHPLLEEFEDFEEEFDRKLRASGGYESASPHIADDSSDEGEQEISPTDSNPNPNEGD